MNVSTGQTVRENLLAFLERRTKTAWAADQDLFESGVVNSLFALELVVHLENEFGLSVSGPDLTMDNFRTVDAMAELALRLSGGGHDR